MARTLAQSESGTGSRAVLIRRTVLTIMFVSALVALAVGYWRRKEAAELVPAADESKAAWYCPHCQRGFELTAKEYEKTLAFDEKRGVERGPRRLSVAKVRCPKCAEWAVAARKCLTDGEIFPPRTADGGHGVCPKCGWDPRRP